MKSKYGVVFDSTCGKTKKEVLKDGNFFIPMIINVNGKDCKSGIDIDNNFLYKVMIKPHHNYEASNIKTSTPITLDIINAFRDGLKKFDELIYIGLSKKFSGTLNSARVVIDSNEELKGKVHIYDSELSAPWTNMFYNDICEIIKNNITLEEIYRKLDFQKGKTIAFLSPGDIHWFYKGGRISRKQYIMGNLMRIKPILIVKNGEFDKTKTYKAMSNTKAIQKMLELMDKVKEWFDSENIKYKFSAFISNDIKAYNLTLDMIVKKYKIKREEISKMFLGAEQTAHMGPNSIGVGLIADFKEK